MIRATLLLSEQQHNNNRSLTQFRDVMTDSLNVMLLSAILLGLLMIFTGLLMVLSSMYCGNNRRDSNDVNNNNNNNNSLRGANNNNTGNNRSESLSTTIAFNTMSLERRRNLITRYLDYISINTIDNNHNDNEKNDNCSCQKNNNSNTSCCCIGGKNNCNCNSNNNNDEVVECTNYNMKECAICLEQLKKNVNNNNENDDDDDDNVIITKEISESSCGHKFHRQCLLEWLIRNQQCPICRTYNNVTIVDNNIEQQHSNNTSR